MNIVKIFIRKCKEEIMRTTLIKVKPSEESKVMHVVILSQKWIRLLIILKTVAGETPRIYEQGRGKKAQTMVKMAVILALPVLLNLPYLELYSTLLFFHPNNHFSSLGFKES